MAMCIHSQEFETCSFGCTLRSFKELRLENDQLKKALDYAKSFIDGYGAARIEESLGREGMDAVLKEINKIALTICGCGLETSRNKEF